MDDSVKGFTRLYNFRVATCKPSVDYFASFKSSIGTEDAQNLIEQLMKTRTEMITTLYSNSRFDIKLSSVENYLPHLLRLWDSLINQQDVKTDRDMLFEWRGSITDSFDCMKSSNVVYDLIMTLQTKVSFY